jgi:hypothetical protein
LGVLRGGSLELEDGDIAPRPEIAGVVRLASPLTPASFHVSRLALLPPLALSFV